MKTKIALQLLGSLVAVLGLSACATTADYQQVVQGWKGAELQSLMGTWGYPKSHKDLPDGSVQYFYEHWMNMQHPLGMSLGIVDKVSDTAPKRPGDAKICKTWFVANANNVITSVRYQGDACSADANYMQRLANPVATPNN